MTAPRDTSRPARSPSTLPVAVCFLDREINQIFAELLNARGVETFITEDLATLSGEVRIITEPGAMHRLDPKHHQRCLVVTNCSSDTQSLGSLSLSRPLTEQKIERALAELLSR